MIRVYYYDIVNEVNELPTIDTTSSPCLSHYYFTTRDKDGKLDAYILVREGESRKYRYFNKWKILYKKTKFSIINDIPVFMYFKIKKPNLTWIGVYKKDTFYKNPNYNGPEELVNFVVNYLKGNENFIL